MKKLVTIVVVALISVLILSSCVDNKTQNAKSAADEYCNMLVTKQPMIKAINYENSYSKDGTIYHFKYEIEYDSGTTKQGVVVVYDYEGDFEVQGMKME